MRPEDAEPDDEAAPIEDADGVPTDRHGRRGP